MRKSEHVGAWEEVIEALEYLRAVTLRDGPFTDGVVVVHDGPSAGARLAAYLVPLHVAAEELEAMLAKLTQSRISARGAEKIRAARKRLETEMAAVVDHA